MRALHRPTSAADDASGDGTPSRSVHSPAAGDGLVNLLDDFGALMDTEWVFLFSIFALMISTVGITMSVLIVRAPARPRPAWLALLPLDPRSLPRAADLRLAEGVHRVEDPARHLLRRFSRLGGLFNRASPFALDGDGGERAPLVRALDVSRAVDARAPLVALAEEDCNEDEAERVKCARASWRRDRARRLPAPYCVCNSV